MRTLLFCFFALIVTSCSYKITNNNYYNCCPAQAAWIDTIGVLGDYTIHVIGTRKDVNYIFSQSSITNVRGFHVVEVVGTNFTVEIRNPHF